MASSHSHEHGVDDEAAVAALHQPDVAAAVHDSTAPLTAEQIVAVDKMRERMHAPDILALVHEKDKHYWTSDHAFKRFLVARKWDVDAACHMYTDTMKFRVRMGVPTITETFTEPAALR
jgi:hypothetical protein